MNVSKANYICTGENVMPAVKNAIAQDKIFEAQLQNYIIIGQTKCALFTNEMCKKKIFFHAKLKAFNQCLNSV